jgi:2-polyprenyl-3-methyl-5-hydroxy-6-metoxy-1,4-benzoquinol methylase
VSYKNNDVLLFYEKLPFNIYGDIDLAVEQIKKSDPLITYTELGKIFEKYSKIKIIDFGCGGGWLVNSISYHHGKKCQVTGVDFNPVAIDYANKIKNKLNLNSNFIKSDLFGFDGNEKYDLIISLGVLHHTNNCHEAIKHICKFGDKNSFIFLGLYHKYGREPFLNHFKNMKNKSEEFKFNEYKKLHKNIADEKKIYSWFRDQVLHPHETQHTFEEISEILIETGYTISSTSINKFKKIKNLKDIFPLEKNFFNYSINKIKNNEYFPGFFITTGKKD